MHLHTTRIIARVMNLSLQVSGWHLARRQDAKAPAGCHRFGQPGAARFCQQPVLLLAVQLRSGSVAGVHVQHDGRGAPLCGNLQ